MNKRFIGPSVNNTIKELKAKKPSLRVAVEKHKAKQIMGLFLRRLREKEGMSQHDLARVAKVPQPAISRIESPLSTVMPRFDVFLRLIVALGYSIDFVPKRLHPHSRMAA